MAETLTQHYAWTKPDPGFSSDTWGVTLNQTIEKIDGQVYINQQAGVPIGAMMMWPVQTPPANWLVCNGQSLSTTGTYAALFAILGTVHNQAGDTAGTFRVPNLSQKYPLGSTSTTTNPVGEKGGNFTNTIATGNLPAHAHPIANVTHSHTVTDPSHNHVITTGGHSHTISTGAHAHSGVAVGLGTGGIIAGAVGGASLTMGNTSTAGDLGGGTSVVGNLGGGTDARFTGISLVANSTGITTTQNVGSGTPLSVVPPYLSVNFIVKYA